GSPVGYVPFVYALVLLGAIIAFARTRNFAFLLYVSLVDILLAPTLSMVPLGGFLASGGVGLWGILAPVGALVFSGPRSGLRWYVAYLAVFITSGVAGQIAGAVSTLPEWFTSTMLGLNVAVGGSIVFILIATFLGQRDRAMDALAREQERSERLLLNVLPREIAPRLKAGENPIADAYEHATVLYADIVGSTMLAERLDAKQLVALLNGIFSRFDLIRDEFNCGPRGTIEVKGKGPMRTWFLVGERGPDAESPRPSRDERSVTLPLETLGRAERASWPPR